jgi:hypothetical protein
MGKSINDYEQGKTALHAACVTNSMDAGNLTRDILPGKEERRKDTPKVKSGI